MARKGVKNKRDVVTAGKIAGAGTKALAGELANAAPTAAAKAATMAAAGMVFDKVVEAGKPSITRVQDHDHHWSRHGLSRHRKAGTTRVPHCDSPPAEWWIEVIEPFASLRT